MKKLLFLGALLLSTVCMNAQTSKYYQEAANPIATNPALWAKVTAPQISWGSTDIRYKKEEPAPIHSAQKSMNLTAWKGEKISAQLVVWTPKALNDLTFMVSDLTSGSATISKENIRTGFVRYVITDELNKDGLGACGYRNSADFDSTLVADVIDHITPTLTLPANSTQGGWISVNIPQGTKAGKYTGTVTVKAPYSASSFRMGFPSGFMAEPLCSIPLLQCGTVQQKTFRFDAPIDETVCRCRW